MAKSSLSLSLPLLLLLLALSFSAAILRAQALGGRVGGISEVPDVEHNEKVQSLGEYSVEEYNSNIGKYQKKGHRTSGRLTFLRVESAKQQVVAGIKYYLQILARDASGEPDVFEAVVVVQEWKKKPRQLLTFSPSPPRQ